MFCVATMNTTTCRHTRRAPFSGSRRPPPVERTKLRCHALLSFFNKNAASSNKFSEKLAYRPNEKVQLAPGVEVSPMGLGTWSWGNQFLWGYKEEQDPELQEVYNLVVSRGINLFDTADSYGTGRLNGKAEQLLGKFNAEYPGSAKVKDSVHIATKFAAYPWRVTAGSMVSACKESQKRTQQVPISIGQLHWSAANYAPLQELGMRAGLADMYDQGLVKAVGVSNYGPKQLQKIHAYLESRDVPLASAQIQYSLLSCGKLQQDTKAVCDDLGITMIAYSPLALGILSGKYSRDTVPTGPRGGLFKDILPQAEPLLDLMSIIAEERNKTMSQVAINWCMCQGTIPIPGARSMSQAQEVLGSLGWRLSAGEVQELSEAAGNVKKTMVQNIFQTS